MKRRSWCRKRSSLRAYQAKQKERARPSALHIPRDPIGPTGTNCHLPDLVLAYSAGAELTIVRRPYDFPFYAGEPGGVEFVRLVHAQQP